MLQARGFAGLVHLSCPLSEEAIPNFRKPSSVQGNFNLPEHLDHPWVLDRPIVERRFLSLGWRVASYDDVEVVRVFTMHTFFDPARGQRTGFALAQGAHREGNTERGSKNFTRMRPLQSGLAVPE